MILMLLSFVLAAALGVVVLINIGMGLMARRPLAAVVTKEKGLALLIALLLLYQTAQVPQADEASLRDSLQENRVAALRAKDAGFASWSSIATGPVQDVEVVGLDVDPDAMAERLSQSYTRDPKAKPLFWREVEIAGMGRVRLGSPETPGIQVISGHTAGGPHYPNLPNRQDLGTFAPLMGRWHQGIENGSNNDESED